MFHKLLPLSLFAALVGASLAPSAAYAQSDDDFDDLLRGPTEPQGPRSVADERRAMEAGEPQRVEVVLPDRKKKVIKTLQKKNFMKIGRFEAMPFVGLVTNDPFVRRIIFGGGIGYHFTEVFGVELQGGFSPDLNRGDWKPVTTQLVDENQVAPEISRMVGHAIANLHFSPLYGKVATVGNTAINFDIYGMAGTGIVYTVDDLDVVQLVGEPLAEATARQIHPAISLGAGLRIAFNRTFALRFEGRNISYVEALDGSRLELKNNLTFQLGASIFFGRRYE